MRYIHMYVCISWAYLGRGLRVQTPNEFFTVKNLNCIKIKPLQTQCKAPKSQYPRNFSGYATGLSNDYSGRHSKKGVARNLMNIHQLFVILFQST